MHLLLLFYMSPYALKLKSAFHAKLIFINHFSS
jgi:hypothetical protein